jgi:hypothetical protein
MLNVIYAECRKEAPNAECPYTECCAECRHAECFGVESCNTESPLYVNATLNSALGYALTYCAKVYTESQKVIKHWSMVHN